MLPKIGLLHVLSIYLIYKEIKYIPHHCLATFTTISSKCAHCGERFGQLKVVFQIIKQAEAEIVPSSSSVKIKL